MSHAVPLNARTPTTAMSSRGVWNVLLARLTRTSFSAGVSGLACHAHLMTLIIVCSFVGCGVRSVLKVCRGGAGHASAAPLPFGAHGRHVAGMAEKEEKTMPASISTSPGSGNGRWTIISCTYR